MRQLSLRPSSAGQAPVRRALAPLAELVKHIKRRKAQAERRMNTADRRGWNNRASFEQGYMTALRELLSEVARRETEGARAANAEVSDRRAHGNENTTGANGGSLH